MKGHFGKHVAKRAKGGAVEEGVDDEAKDKSPSEVYEGAGSETVKEAEKRKHGGKVHKRKHGGKVEGEHSHHRLDRAPRKAGGRVGSEVRPLSMAAKVSERPGGKVGVEAD